MSYPCVCMYTHLYCARTLCSCKYLLRNFPSVLVLLLVGAGDGGYEQHRGDEHECCEELQIDHTAEP